MAETQVEVMVVEWKLNHRTVEGGSPVIGFHEDRRPIFPSSVGFSPPSARAVARSEWPKEGDEECVITLSPKGTTYFAWPKRKASIREINCLIVEGHMLCLAEGGEQVTAQYDDAGKLHIVIEPAPNLPLP